MPTIEEFNAYVVTLSHHDWYYDYSDDGNVWRAGKARQEEIQAKAKQHPIYAELLKTWGTYLRTGHDKVARDARVELLRQQIDAPLEA